MIWLIVTCKKPLNQTILDRIYSPLLTNFIDHILSFKSKEIDTQNTKKQDTAKPEGENKVKTAQQVYFSNTQ